jgi:hypothetical protein
MVKITETYEDGHEWTSTDSVFVASNPDLATIRALQFNRRQPRLSDHGAVVSVETSAIESS